MLGYTTAYPIRVSFGRLIGLSALGHLVSAVPAIALGWVLMPQSLKVWSVAFLPLSVLGIPLTSAFAWLWAKGSNWTNTRFAVIVLVLYPVRMYSMVVALFAGGALYGGLASIATITRPAAIAVSVTLTLVLGWAASRLIAQRLAKYIIRRWAPELSDSTPPTTA